MCQLHKLRGGERLRDEEEVVPRIFTPGLCPGVALRAAMSTRMVTDPRAEPGAARRLLASGT